MTNSASCCTPMSTASESSCCAPAPASCCTPATSGPAEAAESMNLAALSAALEAARGKPLSIIYDGRSTKKGYHVTELKCARITGLDCGANVESWNETIFQVLDIEDSITGQTMTVDKLIGIISKYSKLLGAEADSKISFEVSDGGEAMRIFAFGDLEISGERATLRLVNRVSACKPLVRGIITPANGKNPCGPKTAFSDELRKA